MYSYVRVYISLAHMLDILIILFAIQILIINTNGIADSEHGIKERKLDKKEKKGTILLKF